MKTNQDGVERARPAARRPARRDARAALREHIAEHGLRRSRTRDAVVETFLATREHASVEELTARVRARDPAVGQATVYRTLKLLQECGVAAARQFGDGVTRYEPVLERGHHDHLVCTRCGKIVEFENPDIEKLQLDVARTHGFSTERHRMELYGRCPGCRRAGRGSAGR
ncbi:MAG TPA: transcriptional repressor [Anaeromyxobacter sp.]